MARQATPDVMGDVLAGGATAVPLALVDDNPFQERTEYGELTDLANDIREHGLLQPPVVRQVRGRYELAFGHRRKRACELAGMSAMPVVIRKLSDEEMATIAFAENEQRMDVTAIDKALAIQTMQTRFGWSLQQIADKLSMSRPAVSNLLRLLKLPDEVQTAVISGAISARQAEALVPLAALPEQALVRLSTYDDTKALLEQAMDGKSSDWLRERVGRSVGLVTRGVPDHWSNYDFGELAGIEAATCKGCRHAVRAGEGNTCQMLACWEAKSSAWLGIERADAVASTGVPLLPEGVHYETRTLLYSIHLDKLGLKPYPARPAKPCENLRMTVSTASGTVVGSYVCYHPGKNRCRCLDAAEKAAKKDGTAFWRRLREQTLAALEERLGQFDIDALRLLAWPEMPWAEKDGAAPPAWTAEQCTSAVAQGLVKRWAPYEAHTRPNEAQRQMERLLRLAGVRTIPWSLAGQVEAGEGDGTMPVL